MFWALAVDVVNFFMDKPPTRWSAGAFTERKSTDTYRLQVVAVCFHVHVVSFQFRLYEGWNTNPNVTALIFLLHSTLRDREIHTGEDHSQKDPGRQEKVSSQRVEVCGEPALNQSENAPKDLHRNTTSSHPGSFTTRRHNQIKFSPFLKTFIEKKKKH